MKPFCIEAQYDKLDIAAMKSRPGVMDAIDDVLVALAREERIAAPPGDGLCCSVSLVQGTAEQALLQSMRDQHTLNNQASEVLRAKLATTAALCIRCLITMERA